MSELVPLPPGVPLPPAGLASPAMAGPGGGPLPLSSGVLDSRAEDLVAIQSPPPSGVVLPAPVDVVAPSLLALQPDVPGPSSGPAKPPAAPVAMPHVGSDTPVGSTVQSTTLAQIEGGVGSCSLSNPATVPLPARTDGVRANAPVPGDRGKGIAKPPSRPGNGVAWPPLPLLSPAIEGAKGTSVPLLSFAQVLTQSASIPLVDIDPHGPSYTDQGEPAAFFSPEEISTSCKPFDDAIVAKTPVGRPPYHDIRVHLQQRFKFKQDFTLSALDGRHMLLRFQNHEDYLQVLLKESLFIHGKPFWFSKWTLNFSPEEDSPIVPVWIDLPGLPPNFYIRGMLQSIACSIGPVLQIHRNTLGLTRTDAAKVCVQMDVSKKRPERVWVGVGSCGYWQAVVYPAWPLFCSACRRLGHDVSKCKRKSAQSKNLLAKDGALLPSLSDVQGVPLASIPAATNANKGKNVHPSNGPVSGLQGPKTSARMWQTTGKTAPALAPPSRNAVADSMEAPASPQATAQDMPSMSPNSDPIDPKGKAPLVPAQVFLAADPSLTRIAPDLLSLTLHDSAQVATGGSTPSAKRVDPTPGGSTPLPGGSTPVGFQEPPGLFTILEDSAGSSRMPSTTRLLFSQTASPAIVHQSAAISSFLIADPNVGVGDVAAHQDGLCCADDPQGLEVTEVLAPDPSKGKLVEAPEEGEPHPGKLTSQALSAPGWDASSRTADILAVHNNFVGNAPTQASRPGGLRPRTRLRRSASVP